MFAPLAGTWEDPATGSASATLGALLLSLDGGDSAAFTITQGVEMGRPSLLNVTARRGADGIRSRVGGGCVRDVPGRGAALRHAPSFRARQAASPEPMNTGGAG